MEFNKRLFSLLVEDEINNATLSKNTGIATSRISNFYNGKDMPNLNNALVLANYFRCSFDYLFGIIDERDYVAKIREYNKDIFLTRLNFLLDCKNISKRQLCREIDIDKSCIFNWKNNQKPKPSNLLKIAKYLNCSMDYLLGFK